LKKQKTEPSGVSVGRGLKNAGVRSVGTIGPIEFHQPTFRDVTRFLLKLHRARRKTVKHSVQFD